MQTILYQNAFSYGGIHAVYDEYLTLIIFSSDPGTLAGAGQFTGDGDHDDGLPRGDCLLISVFKDSGRYQAGGGESVTFDQLFVEFSVTDGDSVGIFVVAEAYVQRQDGDILPGVVHIRCGVCDKTYFFHDNIPILFIIVWQLNVSSCLFFWWMLGRKLGKVLFQIMGDPLQGIVEIHPLLLCHAVSAVSQCRVDPGTDFFDYSAAFLGQII